MKEMPVHADSSEAGSTKPMEQGPCQDSKPRGGDSGVEGSAQVSAKVHQAGAGCLLPVFFEESP